MKKRILRKTPGYIAHAAKKPGWVTIKARDGFPRQLTVRPAAWLELKSYSDREFDASCCFDLGIGSFAHP